MSIDSRTQFRLVIVRPGQTEDELICDLQTSQLDDAPSYEALSYFWGEQNNTEAIVVGDCIVQVRSNLAAALRQLRLPYQSRTLWADSLCIDQQNDHEKADQVAIMGQIYRSCSRALVWLGIPSTEPLGRRRDKLLRRCISRSDLNPYTIMHHFLKPSNNHIYDLSCFRHSKIRSNKLVFTRDGSFIAHWKALLEPVRSPWWSRFWCVQETLLAPKATVVFGQWQMDWTEIQTAATAHRQHWITCCATTAAQIPDKYIIFYDLLVLDPEQSQPVIPYNIQAAQNPAAGFKYRELDWVLRVYRHRDCKDPRDKVYGILGLIDQSKHPTVVPDYSMHVTQVYTVAMRSVVTTSIPHLECLSGSGFNSPNYENLLPSWVRDFSIRPDKISMAYEKMRMRAYLLYNADRDLKAHSTQIDDDCVLHLHGSRIDTIVRHGNALRLWGWKHIRRAFKQWLQDADVEPPSRNHKPDEHSRWLSFWRTVAADVLPGTHPYWKRFSEVDMASYMEWVHTTFTVRGLFSKASLHETYAEAIITAIYGRSFFISRLGKFGLCFPSAQSGDEIWIVTGSRVPLVLRRSQKGHRLIGECYLDGAMYGEAATSSTQDVLII
ncbi:hypothetical protein SVAN01_08422 [Stagonosporopsis vannaccii]|nr:hypothetical protein SVAN01_08422 [Stagonosporopsis vannaccii]